MWLRAILLVATVGLAVSPTTVKPLPKLDESRFGGTKHCCLEKNVFSDGKCVGNDTKLQIHCPFSMFMLDPTVQEGDMFYINEKYQLFFGTDETGEFEERFV